MIGDNLYFYMKRAQVGVRKLARATRKIDKAGREAPNGERQWGVSESMIYQLRSGRRGMRVSGAVVSLLAEALGVQSSNLMEDNQVATAMANKARQVLAERLRAQRERR